jgi:hypothetical protein
MADAGRPRLGLKRFNCALDSETEAAVRAAFSRLEAEAGGVSFQRFLGKLVERGLRNTNYATRRKHATEEDER